MPVPSGENAERKSRKLHKAFKFVYLHLQADQLVLRKAFYCVMRVTVEQSALRRN
jgi:hypothetical protein